MKNKKTNLCHFSPPDYLRNSWDSWFCLKTLEFWEKKVANSPCNSNRYFIIPIYRKREVYIVLISCHLDRSYFCGYFSWFTGSMIAGWYFRTFISSFLLVWSNRSSWRGSLLSRLYFSKNLDVDFLIFTDDLFFWWLLLWTLDLLTSWFGNTKSKSVTSNVSFALSYSFLLLLVNRSLTFLPCWKEIVSASSTEGISNFISAISKKSIKLAYWYNFYRFVFYFLEPDAYLADFFRVVSLLEGIKFAGFILVCSFSSPLLWSSGFAGVNIYLVSRVFYP